MNTIISISDLVFAEQLRIHGLFKDYLKEKNIALSEDKKQSRKLFIMWYLEIYNDCSFKKNIKNLSNYFLFISEKQIEKIIFNYE